VLALRAIDLGRKQGAVGTVGCSVPFPPLRAVIADPPTLHAFHKVMRWACQCYGAMMSSLVRLLMQHPPSAVLSTDENFEDGEQLPGQLH
jgi:hypothetical protein